MALVVDLDRAVGALRVGAGEDAQGGIVGGLQAGTPAGLDAGVVADGEDAGRSGVAPKERRVEGTGDEGPEGDAPRGVHGNRREEVGAERAQLAGHCDDAVVVGAVAVWGTVAAQDGPEEGHEGADVPDAERVVQEPARHGGDAAGRHFDGAGELREAVDHLDEFAVGNEEQPADRVEEDPGVFPRLSGALALVRT